MSWTFMLCCFHNDRNITALDCLKHLLNICEVTCKRKELVSRFNVLLSFSWHLGSSFCNPGTHSQSVRLWYRSHICNAPNWYYFEWDQFSGSIVLLQNRHGYSGMCLWVVQTYTHSGGKKILTTSSNALSWNRVMIFYQNFILLITKAPTEKNRITEPMYRRAALYEVVHFMINISFHTLFQMNYFKGRIDDLWLI